MQTEDSPKGIEEKAALHGKFRSRGRGSGQTAKPWSVLRDLMGDAQQLSSMEGENFLWGKGTKCMEENSYCSWGKKEDFEMVGWISNQRGLLPDFSLYAVQCHRECKYVAIEQKMFNYFIAVKSPALKNV